MTPTKRSQGSSHVYCIAEGTGGLRKCPESFSLDAELIREAGLSGFPRLNWELPSVEKQQYFAKPVVSWFKPGYKTCALRRNMALPPWKSRQEQDFISQCVLPFMDLGKITEFKTELPDFFFLPPFPSTLSFLFPMAMNRMFCTKKHCKCHWGKVRTPHTALCRVER